MIARPAGRIKPKVAISALAVPDDAPGTPLFQLPAVVQLPAAFVFQDELPACTACVLSKAATATANEEAREKRGGLMGKKIWKVES